MRRALGALCAVCLSSALGAGVAGLTAASAKTSPHRARPATEKRRCHTRRHHRRCTRVKSHVRRHPPPQTGANPGTGGGSSQPAGSSQGTPAAPGGSGGGTHPPTTLGHLQVIEREFSVIPSRTTVAGGTVAVELDNRGQDPHNLRIERTDSSGIPFEFGLAKPGSVTSQKIDLGPGRWKLYCTLPGHEQAGMHAVISVTG